MDPNLHLNSYVWFSIQQGLFGSIQFCLQVPLFCFSLDRDHMIALTKKLKLVYHLWDTMALQHIVADLLLHRLLIHLGISELAELADGRLTN